MIDDKIKALPAHPVFDGARPDYVPSKPVRRLESAPIKPKVSWADLIGGQPEENHMQTSQQAEVQRTESPVMAPVIERPWPPKVTLPKTGTESYRVVSYLYRHGETSYAELIRQVGSIHARFRENLRKLVMQGRIENHHEGSTIPEGRFALSAECLALFQELAAKASDPQPAEENSPVSEPLQTPTPDLPVSEKSVLPETPAASIPVAETFSAEVPAATVESLPVEEDVETRIAQTITDLHTLLGKLVCRTTRAEHFLAQVQKLLAEYSEEA